MWSATSVDNQRPAKRLRIREIPAFEFGEQLAASLLGSSLSHHLSPINHFTLTRWSLHPPVGQLALDAEPIGVFCEYS